MAFPDAPRVLYQINPLDEVVCQLVFPPILRIDAEPPAAFQESLRDNYPLYALRSPLHLPADLPPDFAQTLAANFPFAGQKLHEFADADKRWSVGLTRNSLSLTCRRYTRWEHFRARLSEALAALSRHYAPAFFNRVGLRYRDAIRRSRLGLPDAPWHELLRPGILGPLGDPAAASAVTGFQSAALIQLPDGAGQVQLAGGLYQSQPDGEVFFLIDSDFFSEQRTELAHAFDRLDPFNRHSGRLFRWCITERLHRALGPGPVPPL